MTEKELLRQRLYNQYLSRRGPTTPEDLVAWFGAVQAQDYPGGKWAIGQRLPGSSEADIENAIAAGAIIRTWPMRGTLHFVARDDVRWMLELLTPRVLAGATLRMRRLEIDDAVLARSQDVLVAALQGGKQLSRLAVYKLMDEAHISTAGQRGLHILWLLAQQGLICFGARQGKQPAFVLLHEWAPKARKLERDQALAEAAGRYFASHGPATLYDFAWWSGLSVTDARAGLEAAKSRLVREVVDGKDYWMLQSAAPAHGEEPAAYLLPPYDEYLVAYKERSAVLGWLQGQGVTLTPFEVLGPTIVVNGDIVGTWNRVLAKGSVAISLHLSAPLAAGPSHALSEAAGRYGQFFNRTVDLS